MFDELNLLAADRAEGGPMQMALDEVLLRRVTRPTLRLYQWSSPCVSFGYFQQFSEVTAVHPSLPLVRRWTGGGIVEHGCKERPDLTFSLMIPRESAAAKLAPYLFYQHLHHALAKSLASYLKAAIQLASELDVIAGPSCFSAPARDDLLWEGTKILGGAQRRSAGALLYQGSLQGRREGGWGKFPNDLLARSLSNQVTFVALEPEIREEASLLAASRYGSQVWTARR